VAVFDRGVDLASPQEIGADERRDMLISYRSGDMVAPAIGEKEALRSMVEEFGAAITGRRAPLTDGRAGLRVLDILEAASRSLEFKGAVVGLRAGH
jgi:predicted dehydrogenase